MKYEITLIEADLRDPKEGNMKLGLVHEGSQKAKLEYLWDEAHFTATFYGNAPNLPVAAHPTQLLQKPIAALHALKTEAHDVVTDVFRDHSVTIDLSR